MSDTEEQPQEVEEVVEEVAAPGEPMVRFVSHARRRHISAGRRNPSAQAAITQLAAGLINDCGLAHQPHQLNLTLISLPHIYRTSTPPSRWS